MMLLKVLILQSFWFLIVLYAKTIAFPIFLLITISLLLFNHILYKTVFSKLIYTLLILTFTCIGLAHDQIMLHFNFIQQESYQRASLLLWPIFICYYGDVFHKLKDRILLQFVLGGIFGPLTYYSAYQLQAWSIPQHGLTSYLLFSGAFWSLFFPMSFKIFYAHKFWNKLIDKTIIFSFDATGFKRHQAILDQFQEPLTAPKESRALVTGGTSGIGAAVADTLSKVTQVTITGRSKNRGEEKANSSPSLTFEQLDLIDWHNIDEFCKNTQVYDYIVLNAGGMPETYMINEQGVEHQCASQLLGHYRLISKLKEHHKLKENARIVWVSSGGMYLKKLEIDKLFIQKDYDKVETYANVKRAQITLVEEMAKDPQWKSYQIFSMHPGWVKTSGLTSALPGFTKFIGKRLRSADQGADTICWLLLTKERPSNGGFFFDRQEVSPYINASFIPSEKERDILLQRINFFLHQVKV